MKSENITQSIQSVSEISTLIFTGNRILKYIFFLNESPIPKINDKMSPKISVILMKQLE
jgi:hypothetical protein